MKSNNKKYKLGLTWGAFEIFHFGHLNLFKNAKEQCEELIVCVSDDEYIKKHKGHNPIIPYAERIRIIEELRCVDGVDIQNSGFGKKEAVRYYKPDVLFVGSDWNPETYTGEGLGIKIVYLPYTKGISSSSLYKKLNN